MSFKKSTTYIELNDQEFQKVTAFFPEISFEQSVAIAETWCLRLG